jgi:hypothetical protein
VPQGFESGHAGIEAFAEYMRMAYRGVDEIEMVFDRVELPAVFGDVPIEFLIDVEDAFDDEVDLAAKILDTGFNASKSMVDAVKAVLNTSKAMLDTIEARVDLRELLAHFGAGFFDPRAEAGVDFFDPRAQRIDPRAEEFEAVLDQVDQVLLCHASDGTSEIARYRGLLHRLETAIRSGSNGLAS